MGEVSSPSSPLAALAIPSKPHRGCRSETQLPRIWNFEAYTSAILTHRAIKLSPEPAKHLLLNYHILRDHVEPVRTSSL
jgi:hypothetical protein